MKLPFNLKLYHDTRHKPNSKGLYPIKLVITERLIVDSKNKYGKQKHHSTEKYCSVEVFQVLFPEYSKSQINVPKPEVKRIKNEYLNLSIALETLLKKAKAINEKRTVFTAKDLIQEIGENIGTVSISEYYNKHIDRFNNKEQISSANHYTYSLKSILDHNKNKDLNFYEITVEWLEKYEKAMKKKGLSTSSIGTYLKPLKTVFLSAIKNKDCPISANDYPFGIDNEKYSIKQNYHKRNRHLSLEDFKKLKAFKCHTFNQLQAKEFFLFSYYCGGINMVDIIELTNDRLHIDKGCFIYSRRKNEDKTIQKKLNVPLNELTMSIIEKYRGSGKYVFNILEGSETKKERETKRANFRSKINKQLKKIARDINIDQELHFQMARHTAMNTLLNEGVSRDQIKDLAMHSNVRTTENYIKGFGEDAMNKLFDKL